MNFDVGLDSDAFEFGTVGKVLPSGRDSELHAIAEVYHERRAGGTFGSFANEGGAVIVFEWADEGFADNLAIDGLLILPL